MDRLTGADLQAAETLALNDPQLQKDLEDYSQLLQANPLNGVFPLYEDHPQHHFWQAWEETMMFAGGNRAGKTVGGVIKDFIELLPREWVPEHLLQYKHLDPVNGPIRGRIVTPGAATTGEVVIKEKLRQYAPPGALRGGSWADAFDKRNNILWFECGSWLQLLTSEMDVDKHSGAELEFVHFDEEPDGDKGHKLFIENTMRLVTTNGHFWMTLTPDHGLSWSYDEIYEKADEDGFYVVHADMDQNPTISERAKRLRLENLTKEERQAKKEGKYVHFGGKVYPELTEDHIVEAPDQKHIRGLDEVVVGIDPGMRKTAVVWVGFDKDDVAMIFDELYLDEMTIDLVVEEIKEKNEYWNIEPDLYIIDPSSRNRTQINAEDVEAEFQRFDIFTTPGYNPVEAGCFQLKRRLQHNALLISEDCEKWLWEARRYRMKETDDGSFAVVKQHDHLQDAGRYAITYRTWGPEEEELPRAYYRPGYPIPPEMIGSSRPMHPFGAAV